METPKLPDNWKLLPDRECKWSELPDLKVFGLATKYKDDQGNVLHGEIQFYHYPGLDFVRPCVVKHETGHAWGVSGCKHIYCIMYEGKEDSLWEKLAVPFQLLYGIDYCPECRAIIEKNMKEQGDG